MSVFDLLANDPNLSASFRAVFANSPRPIDPISDDEKDPEQKPVPVSQTDED